MRTQHLRSPYSLVFNFEQVSKDKCPCNDTDVSVCHNLPECSYDMTINELCEANNKLPDNNKEYDVNNCPGDSDVFKYKGGERRLFYFKLHSYKFFEFDIVIL